MPSAGRRTRLKGSVVSDKADKTVVVSVQRRTKHPLYRKYITRRKKYAVHDEKNQCRTGDVVEIVISRPYSKTKRWAVTRILQSSGASMEGDLITKETPQ